MGSIILATASLSSVHQQGFSWALLAICPFLSRISILVWVLVLLFWSPFQDLSLMWGLALGPWWCHRCPEALKILSSKSETRCLLHPIRPQTLLTPPAPTNMFSILNWLTGDIFSRKKRESFVQKYQFVPILFIMKIKYKTCLWKYILFSICAKISILGDIGGWQL